MSDTTYEDVRRCPQCGEPGEAKKGSRLRGTERGSSSITFTCHNSRCRWCNTTWIVQVRADGTFPAAIKRRDKQFPTLPYNPTIVDSFDTLQALTTKPGAEIRSR